MGKYQQMQGQLQQLYQKVGELEGEVNEYKVVTETLEKCDPTRKCFRMIGGVLVERQVKEVLPALAEQKSQVCPRRITR
jgi:prefoldin subunit 2